MKPKRPQPSSILITGSSGFLGTFVVNEFKKYFTNSKIHSPRSREFDLFKKKSIQRYLKKTKPDLIVHLAGTGYAKTFTDFFKLNVLACMNLLEAISAEKRKTRLLVAGSAAEYGALKSKTAVIEKTNCNPINDYGVTKYMQTQLALDFAEANASVEVVIARVFNVLGPNPPANSALSDFLKQISKIKTGKINKIKTRELDSHRDFIDVRDVASAFRHLAVSGKNKEIYNICSQKSVSMREVLYSLLKLAKVKKSHIEESVPPQKIIQKSLGSNKKIKSHTSWNPKHAFEDSIKFILSNNTGDINVEHSKQ